MNLKRTLTIAVAGGAVAAWFAGAATSIHPPEQPPLAIQAPAIDARGAALASEVARLHDRLRPTTSPRQPGRNLFTFRAAPVRPSAALAVPATVVQAPPIAEPSVPPPPMLKLSGIGEDPGDDGPVRTAIISAPGQLYIVKEGDTVTPRYRVAKISSDVVELSDVLDGSARRLALR